MKTLQSIKTKKGQATAKSITESAMKLFKIKGYDNTTIVDICHAANVGYGTLYHYFKTKQDIMIHFVLEECEDIQVYYNNLDKTSYADVIEKVCKYQLSYYLIKGQSFISAWYSAMLLQKKDFFDKADYVLTGILEECFKKGKETNEFKEGLEPDFMTQTVLNLLYMVTTDWCYASGNMDLHEEFRKQYIQIMGLFRK